MGSLLNTLFRSDLHVEGAPNRWSLWKDRLAFKRTQEVLKKAKYRLQYLEDYVQTHPELLLSPLRENHERVSACGFERIDGWKSEAIRKMWQKIPAVELKLDLLAVLPNARMWGYPFFVSTEDRVLLRDVSWDFRIFRKAAQEPPVNREFSGKVAILPLHRCRNYFHWLMEVLPRIQMLEEENLWNKIPVVVPPLSGFFKETLDLLGLKENLRLEFNPDQDHWQFEEAVYPSRLGASRKLPIHAVKFLRDRFVANSNQKKRRIYYSRQGSSTRRVLNEERLLPLLTKYGFEIFTGISISFADQVTLFSQAEAVVGCHGAGLANLAFCSPRTPVLELMGSRYVNPIMGEICESASLPYSVLVGKTTHEHGHYEIDIEIIESWLKAHFDRSF